MYLKRLEAQRFKSFAQRIAFDLHPGVTAIVGGNGSGRSNVVAAIQWAIGNLSLRGEEMSNVICEGGASISVLDCAEVTLTIDNSDQRLSFDADEVVVMRRLHRTGSAEHAVNGSPCRVRDVRDLFHPTGLGIDGYAILGQGGVETLIDDDRRAPSRFDGGDPACILREILGLPVDSAREIVGMPPRLLSRGEGKALALACMMATVRERTAPLAILDEPDTGFDDECADRLLRRLRRGFGEDTQVLITSKRHSAVSVADAAYQLRWDASGGTRAVRIS